MKSPLLVLLAVLSLAACQTVERKKPLLATDVLRVGLPAEAWEVLDAQGEPAGLVVRFRSREAHEPIYVVRNLWHQDLGRIDMRGRAFRYVPHAKEAAWVGSGTFVQGVERILQIDGCQVFPVPLAAEPAEPTPGELERRRADGYGRQTSQANAVP